MVKNRILAACLFIAMLLSLCSVSAFAEEAPSARYIAAYSDEGSNEYSDTIRPGSHRQQSGTPAAPAPAYKTEYDWGEIYPEGCVLPDGVESFSAEELPLLLDSVYFPGYSRTCGGVRYRFSGWTADAPDENNIVKIHGRWNRLYCVTVYRDEGVKSHTGGGYYAPGETVTVIPEYEDGYGMAPVGAGRAPVNGAEYTADEQGVISFVMPEQLVSVQLDSAAALRYHADGGGSVTAGEEKVPADAAQDRAEGSIAVPDGGFALEGWYTGPNGTGERLCGEAHLRPVTAELFTVFDYYAHFVPEISVLTYAVAADCAGMGSVSLLQETAGYSIKGSAASPAEGYRFLGWYDCTGTLVSTRERFVPSMPETGWKDTTFFARFEENT